MTEEPLEPTSLEFDLSLFCSFDEIQSGLCHHETSLVLSESSLMLSSSAGCSPGYNFENRVIKFCEEKNLCPP